ncbi:hypothetical protein H1P_1260004 [Hyella patelloides LEGE 07179]|uniref:Uncharacterized protein n=1 Tax=Hyella patelloides LEGE 07179 TaxID=945734 RepID=A0A563VKQ3_9CYAN|nr:hypothetical protein H1P_1260004 [Hyella patelloides LEGE 07179]
MFICGRIVLSQIEMKFAVILRKNNIFRQGTIRLSTYLKFRLVLH